MKCNCPCTGTTDEGREVGLGETNRGKKNACPPRSAQAGEMDEREPIQVQTQQFDGKSHRLYPAQMDRTDCLRASWQDGN